MVPNFIDDLDLSVLAFRLYVHYLRWSNSRDHRFPGRTFLKKKFKVGQAAITAAKEELVVNSLIKVKTFPAKDRRADEVTILNVWDRNYKHLKQLAGAGPDGVKPLPFDEGGLTLLGQGAGPDGVKGLDPAGSRIEERIEEKEKDTPLPPKGEAAPLGVKAPLPPDWRPPQDLYDLAVQWYATRFPKLSVEHETKQFVDKMLSNGKKSCNWAAEWKAYIRNSPINYERWGMNSDGTKKKPVWKMDYNEIYDTYGDPSTWPPEVKERMEQIFQI